MPGGLLKNTLYGAVLPLLGKRCAWSLDPQAQAYSCEKVLHDRKTVGASVQFFRNGKPEQTVSVGFSSLQGRTPVTAQTCFRTASIAKMVTALLVMRLQTLGRLNVTEELGALWGEPIRNPYCPEAPITLGMLMSHTSSIVDHDAYFASFSSSVSLSELLASENAFARTVPGTVFCYSNFAAGLIGSLLEKRFGVSFETLVQQELFEPLHVCATFDITKLSPRQLADSYRVLPFSHAFDAQARQKNAHSLLQADPEHRFLLTSGSLFLSASDLATLTLAAWNGADGFLNDEALREMHTPLHFWPDRAVQMKHGMGLSQLQDDSVCPVPIWGHQGFAYGAVNGVFFDASGTGFALLNNGAEERRQGHLALINRDLIRLCFGEAKD